MKFFLFVFVILGVLLINSHAAPRRPRPHTNCMEEISDCDLRSGPVCGIDDSGIMTPFENQCMALMTACEINSFFVEVKPGVC